VGQLKTAEALGINRDTWRLWRQRYPVINAVIEECRREKIEEIKNSLPASILKQVTGYEATETVKEYEYSYTREGKFLKEHKRLKRERVITKFIQPNSSMTQFAASNLDMANFPNKLRFEAEVTNNTPAGLPGGALGLEAQEMALLEALAEVQDKRRKQDERAADNRGE